MTRRRREFWEVTGSPEPDISPSPGVARRSSRFRHALSPKARVFSFYLAEPREGPAEVRPRGAVVMKLQFGAVSTPRACNAAWGVRSCEPDHHREPEGTRPPGPTLHP